MVTTVNRVPGWFLYVGWVVLSVISLPVAFGISWMVISLVEMGVGDTMQVGGQTHITEDYLSMYIFFPMVGLLTGFLQYLLLRRYLQRMSWWIVATTLGWSLAFLGARLLSQVWYATFQIESSWLVVGIAVFVGGAIGLAQWSVLHRRVERAVWWIPANILGWGLVGLITGGTLIGALDLISLSTIPAIVTSAILWLLIIPQVSKG